MRQDRTHRQSLGNSANDYPRLLKAGLVAPPGGTGSVVIIGQSTNPQSQQSYASHTPGAVTVEAVDLRDMVSFAKTLNLDGTNAVRQIAEFAEKLMTNVGANDLVSRLDVLRRGSNRKPANDAESAALALENDRCFARVAEFLVELNKMPGVRVYRPHVLRSCLRALDLCGGASGLTFYDAAVRMREQSRALGRSLPRRAVGSTLLLKGLEADAAVLLCADEFNARHLYVAMTRGSKLLVVCSQKSILNPAW
jgi:DNA helicase-2/ATP-dependent DNA helicase PcrA